MSILDAKSRISAKYLGKGGVHGVGVSKERGAIRIHMTAPETIEEEKDREELLQNVRKDAAPYEVLTEVEDSASAGKKNRP